METMKSHATPEALLRNAAWLSNPTATNNDRVGESADTPAGYHLLVECLTDNTMEPTVIVDNDRVHRFTKLFRAFREADWARTTSASAHAGLALVSQTVEKRAPFHGVLSGHGVDVPIDCVPIVGPTGAVHAVRMDAGDTATDGGIPVIPLEFDSRYIARFGAPHGMPALFRTDTTWTLPALLERVVHLDKRLELISMFDPIEPAAQWCESLVLDDPTTHKRRHLWMAARSASDQNGLPTVRAVIADITALVPAPGHDPLLEHLASRTARGHGSALMDLRTTLMHSVCCREDPRLAQWRYRNPELHPADMPAVMQALGAVADNRPASAVTRIRFSEDARWTTLHAECAPLTNYARPQANIDFWIED